MYTDLTDSQKSALNNEQKSIIDSKEKYIVVSASPGCGKTFTLLSKIRKDLNGQSPFFGIIGCSFTRESANELITKLGSAIDLSYSFIGTIDSFVLSIIVKPYLNRCLHYLLKTTNRISDNKLVISIPSYKSKSNEISRIGSTHSEFKSYYEGWKKQLVKGNYEICYCEYLLAEDMIKGMPEVKSFISSRFTGIYVDEAQDLNEFQFNLIKVLKEECGLNVFLIGDKDQSIYIFRGAKPDFFVSLAQKGYKEYRIDISVRCHKSIMDFADIFLNGNHPCINQDCHVFNHPDLDFTELDKLLSEDTETLLLCKTNDMALFLYNYSETKKFGYIYTKQLEIQDEEFSGTYMRLIEELLKFKLNFNNKVSSLTYSIEKIETILLDYSVEKDVRSLRKALIDINCSESDYLFKVFEKLHITIPESVKTEITQKLQDNVCRNHYLRTEQNKRIMTIHSAKGLESKRVIVFISTIDYFFNKCLGKDSDEFRLYYVAFSRAKESLHIFYQSNDLKTNEPISQDLIKNKITNDLNMTKKNP
jgi:superfamily I DNA/RNA helicase